MFETFNAPSQFEDRWYQVEAEQAWFDYFDNGGRGNPVVAMPTGTGKSVVIAKILRRIYQQRCSRQRVMMLTHVKELIEQNANKLRQLWATAPLGIYSAGLKQKNAMMPITFGGVATVKNQVRKFGHIDLLFIDECHLLNPEADTMYQAIIAELLVVNPWLKVTGFTATPYRMKQGLITDGGIFTDICYDITDYESFNRLIAEGYLSPLIPKRTDVEIDTSDVGIVGNDFNQKQLNAVTDTDEMTYATCKETVEFGTNRASWLWFSNSIENAEHVAECLRSFGIVAAASHSKLDPKENDARVAAFKRGDIRCLVNMGKFTTGFDHPPIDLISMGRATASPGLWVQMLGRGTRPFAGDHYFPRKDNCLVLDFAGNTRRLGPINDPMIPRKPGKGGGDAPIRICTEGFRYRGNERYRANDGCGAYNHTKVRNCCNCNMEFDFASKLNKQAGTEALLRSDAPQIEYFGVNRVLYNLHVKRDRVTGNPLSAPSVKVSYICGLHMFSTWLCFEGHGLAKHKANEWWRQHMNDNPPQFTHEALQYIQGARVPTKIRVHVNKRHPEVLGYEF